MIFISSLPGTSFTTPSRQMKEETKWLFCGMYRFSQVAKQYANAAMFYLLPVSKECVLFIYLYIIDLLFAL